MRKRETRASTANLVPRLRFGLRKALRFVPQTSKRSASKTPVWNLKLAKPQLCNARLLMSHKNRIIADLTRRLRRFECGGGENAPTAVASTGTPALDALFPEGGLRRGTILEWLCDPETSHGWRVALTLVRELAAQSPTPRPVLIVDPDRRIHPPAVAGLGIDLQRVIFIRPAQQQDVLWSIEQALRCRAVEAVLGRLETGDAQVLRRLQLAAEVGRTIGMFVRGPRARRQKSWADVRFQIDPLPSVAQPGGSRMRLEVVHSRGSVCGRVAELEIDDETGALSLVSELADSTLACRAS